MKRLHLCIFFVVFCFNTSCFLKRLPEPELSPQLINTFDRTTHKMLDLLVECRKNNDRFYAEFESSYILSGAGESVPIIGRRDWGARPVVKEEGRSFVPYTLKQPICLSIHRITVHHTHGLYTINGLQIFHQNIEDPKADIAYHFFINEDGYIYEGRPLGYMGSHSERDNSNNVGIVLNGNFQEQKPTHAQLNSLFKLIKALHCPCSVLGGIYTHRQRKAFRFPGNPKKSTLCPGDKLNQEVMDFMKKEGLGPISHKAYQ